MNRYTITYYTKAGRTIVSPELISDLSEREFIEETLKLIEKK